MAAVEFQLSRKMIDWIANSQGVSIETLADQVMPKKINKFLLNLSTVMVSMRFCMTTPPM